MVEPAGGQFGADQINHAGELGRHQDPAALFDQGRDHLDETSEPGASARLRVAVSPDQTLRLIDKTCGSPSISHAGDVQSGTVWVSLDTLSRRKEPCLNSDGVTPKRARNFAEK